MTIRSRVTSKLGSTELLVMLAIMALGDKASGQAINHMLTSHADISLSDSHMANTLRSLAERKYITRYRRNAVKYCYVTSKGAEDIAAWLQKIQLITGLIKNEPEVN